MKQLTFVALAALCATSLLWAQTGDDFAMKIIPATSALSAAPGTTASGTVDLTVTFDSAVNEVQGWSFGVQAVPAAGVTMNITDVAKTAQLLTLKDGAPADFSTTAHYLAADLVNKAGDCKPSCTGLSAAAVTQGCVIDFDAVITMPATTGFPMLNLKVAVSGTVGDVEAEAGRLVFTSAVGSPPVQTLGVVGGNSFPPTVQEPAIVRFVPKICNQPVQFTIEVQGGGGGEGAKVNSVVTLNFNSDPANVNAGEIQGWSYGLCVKDAAKLAVLSATSEGTATATIKNGDSPDYNNINATYGNGVTQGVVIDFDALVKLPAQNDYTALIVESEIRMNTEGDFTFLAPCNKVLGVPPVAIVMVMDGNSIPGSLSEGTNPAEDCCNPEVCNVAGRFDFVPGNKVVAGSANGDGRLDVADGIYILSYLFRSGPAPKCIKAADVNGDCVLDSSDAIGIIYYLFQPQVPPHAEYPAPVYGTGCILIRSDVCPLLTCEADECE